MASTSLLVDYENIGKIDLAAIPDGVHARFFFGAAQKTVRTEFLMSALKLGERFVLTEISGQGPNALDFHIAYYLGEILAHDATHRCIILSKDKGFDPLVKHLVGRGFAVSRVSTLADTQLLPHRSAAVKAAAPRPAAPRAEAARPAPPKAAAPARSRSKAVPAAPTPYDRALRRLSGMAQEKRPQKRKRLVADLYSHLAKKLSEAEVNAVVEQLIAEGKLVEAGGVISYRI